MEIFERFIKAYNLARGYNDAEQAALAIELLRQARADGASWANAYRIVPTPKAEPRDKIKMKNFLNPHTQDVRSWTIEQVWKDYKLRESCGIPIPECFVFLFGNSNRDKINNYAAYLREVTPQPDRISGVYMMFQRDMKYGHCVKIGSSIDCVDRQNQYITCNPFAIKGPVRAASNPREEEKRCHEILAKRFNNVDSSREWFAIDYATYKELKNNGFDYFKDE